MHIQKAGYMNNMFTAFPDLGQLRVKYMKTIVILSMFPSHVGTPVPAQKSIVLIGRIYICPYGAFVTAPFGSAKSQRSDSLY